MIIGTVSAVWGAEYGSNLFWIFLGVGFLLLLSKMIPIITHQPDDIYDELPGDERVWQDDYLFAIFRPQCAEEKAKILIVSQGKYDQIIQELSQDWTDFSSADEAREAALDYLHANDMIRSNFENQE